MIAYKGLLPSALVTGFNLRTSRIMGQRENILSTAVTLLVHPNADADFGDTTTKARSPGPHTTET